MFANEGVGRSRGRSGGRSELGLRRPGSLSAMAAVAAASSGAAYQPQSALAGPGRARGRVPLSQVLPTPLEPLRISETLPMALKQMSLDDEGADRKNNEGESLRTRPEGRHTKKGSSGEIISLTSNYFGMTTKPDWKILQYRVDFDYEEDRIYIKKRLLRQHQLPPHIFDGSLLFCITRLTPNDSPLILTSKRERDDTVINITLKLVGELHSMDHNYLQFLNIMLRVCMEGLHLQRFGRSYFDPKASVSLEEWKLELLPGYITSIRQHEQKLMMCCDITNKILRTDTVYDQLRIAISSGGRNAAVKALLGVVVITKYNNKTYRIGEIAWDKNPMSTFLKSGKAITFFDYYKSKYNFEVKDKGQPLLVSLPTERERRSGDTPPVLLIPEICNMTGLSEEQRANFGLMKAIGNYTRQDPMKRVQALLRFSSRFTSSPAVIQEFRQWEIAFDKDLQRFNGRVLRPEEILQGQARSCSYVVENANWRDSLRDFKLFGEVACLKWAVLVPTMESAICDDFVRCLLRVSGSLGFSLSTPKVIILENSRTATYVQELHKILDERPQMVMVVVPNNKGDVYHTVKKICCVERPTLSQVITGTTFRKRIALMSLATNVAIQMATKLGAEPWALNIPVKDTMIIGYDSYHDTVNKSMSVGAVVATTNQKLTRFASFCTFHKHHEELLNQLGPCIDKAIVKYKEENSSLPTRIIVFRDGVGDGQIEFVKKHEIPSIKKVFERNKFSPRFAYVIVSKRINTKFFRINESHVTNPPSGTVIDDVVTLPERYDFFLVSQSVREGTVNPTSYNVIEDTSGLKPDHMQRLTYKLTHLYYNWPGTVRVPSVCQYAHKLAFLVGQSIHREPNPELDEFLYYL